MFRIGGVAEGITSGLDQTQLTASRPGFFNGGNTPILDRTVKSYPKYHEALSKIRGRPRDTGLSDFLISTGLDLVSRPRAGNIFQQVATSAKGPYEQWSAMRSSRGAEEDKLSAALFGDVMDLETRLEEARIKAKGEEGKGKQFEYKGKYEDYEALIKEQRDLEAEKRKIQKDREGMPENIDTSIIDNQLRQIEEKIEDNARLQGIFVDKEEDQVRAAILKGISNGIFTFEDLIVYDETGVPPKSDETFAQGGRAGYQNAGAVIPAAAPAPGNMDQGQDSPVQNLSYEELRSRLPASITDDIIQLIANSQEALVDFANIQTQRDIKSFNQKYQVELVLPQEA